MNPDPQQSIIIDRFRILFQQWNQRINLSAARTPADLDQHIRDSLHVVPVLADLSQPGARVIDVGSGGGFPVVIAAICLPGLTFTALEPVHKKHAFLRTAIRELGLTNLDAKAERSDQHSRTNYDLAMSRATFDLVEWLAIGATLVREGGAVLGFEAVRRDDVGDGVERVSYQLDGKARSIVIARKR